MNKQFKSLIERAVSWPASAQAEAARVLAEVERKHGFESTRFKASRKESDLARVRNRLRRSLADPRSDLPLEKSFARIERLHAKRMKVR
jgi:hypothetical protein